MDTEFFLSPELMICHLFIDNPWESLGISIVNLSHSELMSKKSFVPFLLVHELISFVYLHMLRQVEFLCDKQEII